MMVLAQRISMLMPCLAGILRGIVSLASRQALTLQCTRRHCNLVITITLIYRVFAASDVKRCIVITRGSLHRNEWGTCTNIKYTALSIIKLFVSR